MLAVETDSGAVLARRLAAAAAAVEFVELFSFLPRLATAALAKEVAAAAISFFIKRLPRTFAAADDDTLASPFSLSMLFE